jgi:hypothetical protein
VTQALGNTFPPAQHRDTFLATRTGQDNADFPFSRIGLADFVADGLDQLAAASVEVSGFCIISIS